jgi:hypothetical protein
MEYIFVVHLFGIIDVDTIFYKLSQTQNRLWLDLELHSFWDRGSRTQLDPWIVNDVDVWHMCLDQSS